MAFTKYAKAQIVKPQVTLDGWHAFRTAADAQSGLPYREAPRTASESVALQEYDPNQFMLSHCTIIASVDTEEASDPLGVQMVDGFQIDRRYADWQVTPNTVKYINNNCFVAGTMILMADGTEKPIEHVVVGDSVVSHTGAVRRVTETFTHPFRGHLRVVRRLGDQRLLEVSPEHPFHAMTPAVTCACGCGTALDRRSRKAAVHRFQDFVRGHGARGRKNPEPGFGWVSAALLDRGDMLSTPRLQGDVAATGVTPGKARLLGYYLAEGFYHRQKPHRVSSKYRESGNEDTSIPVGVSFGLNLDEMDTLVAEIRSLLMVEFGVGSSVARTSEGGVVVHSQQSVELIQYIKEHATEYATTKKLAACVLQWPLPLQREVVRGWLEGDGCVESTAGGWVSVTSASPDLISQMHVILARLGVFATRHVSRAVGRKRVHVANGGVQIVDDPGKECVSYRLQIGSVHAEGLLGGSHLEPLYRRAIRGRRKHTLRFRVRDDRMMFPVRSVEKRWHDGLVYNFETDTDHSYVANGVAVHNSDAWERKLLLSSFRTFVGGENYVEHIQIPELSKGKIIDAASRDIGDSIYVDILVATDRRHAPLINAITTGRLQTLSMGCFIEDTQVTMADGTRVPIQDVQPGDMVVTGKGRVREVLNHQRRLGSWGMRTVHAVGLPTAITSTGTHPYYVLRPAKVCACGCGEALVTKDKNPVRRLSKRFKRGHDKRIFNPNGTYSLEEARRLRQEVTEVKKLRLERVRADELQVGDYLAFPRLNGQEEKPGVSPGRAKLLGYFLAEGSFLKYKGRRVEVQFNFSLGERNTLAAEVVELLKSEFPEANTPWVQEREDRNIATVHVTGRGVPEWFYRHGGEYSHRKRLSHSAMWWSVDAHAQMVEAWLRGDGYQRKEDALVGTTTSYDLACQMHALMVRCGVFARMECVLDGCAVALDDAVNGGTSVRGSNGKLAAFNLCVPSAHVSTLGFERSGSRAQHLRVLDDHVVFPVTKIESSRHEGWVYDIEVEEDHTYIADGAMVSNCQVAFTVCTKCGNVAEDEVQLCPHIRYMKGNDFYDALGNKRKIAELCFPPGTRVINGSGVPVAIDDLQVGDAVITHKGRRRSITQTFERRYDGPLTTFKVLGMPHTSFRSTPQHPYYVLSPRETCACGCDQPLSTRKTFSRAEYTRTYVAGHNPSSGLLDLQPQAFAFKNAEDIKIGDLVALPIPKDIITPCDVDLDRAELLGWFAAEGSYVKRGGERVGVQFTLNAEDEGSVAERLSTLLSQCFEPELTHRSIAPTHRGTRRGYEPKLNLTDRVLMALEEAEEGTTSEVSQLSGVPEKMVRAALTRYSKDGLVRSRSLGDGERPEIKGRCRSRARVWTWQGDCPVSRRHATVRQDKPRTKKAASTAKRRVTPHVYVYPRSEGGFKLVVVYSNQAAADWFYKHSGEYSGSKRLSPDAIFWPLSIQEKLLKAYFHGDGQSDETSRHSVSSVSDTLITQMQIIAARCGFWVRRQVIFEGEAASIQAVGGDSAPVGFDNCRPRYEMHIQPSQKSIDFFGFAKAQGHVRNLAPAWRQHAGYMLHRVTDVGSEVYSGLVHNISVEEDESYLVDGIATHNCGHITAEPGSVKFIEASWVANPAFTGAVLRSILQPSQVRALGDRIQVAFNEPTRTADPTQLQKAARHFGPTVYPRQVVSEEFDFDAPSQDEAPAEDAKKEDNPLEKAINDLVDDLKEKAIGKIREQMGDSEPERVFDDRENTNNNLVKEACKYPEWRRVATVVLKHTPNPATARKMIAGLVLYKRGGWSAVRALSSLTKREMLALSRIVDRLASKQAMAGEGRVYRAVLATGGPSQYPDMATYLEACAKSMGRAPNQQETKALVLKGRIYECGR